MPDPAFSELCHAAQKANTGPCHLLFLTSRVMLQKSLTVYAIAVLFKRITLTPETKVGHATK